MSKFKGVLKKISGKFKMYMGPAAAFIGIAGGVLGLGGIIGNAVVVQDVVNDYKESGVYQTYKQEQIDELERQYQDNEITTIEFQDELVKISETEESNSEMKKIINKDLEGNEEFQAKLKKADIPFSVALSGLGLLIVSLGGLITYAAAGKKIEMSAKIDLMQAKEELTKTKEEPAKPAEKKEKYILDVSEEDENLKNTSDEYFKC